MFNLISDLFLQELDLKTKKWTLSKKQPCTLNCVYHAERPIFKKVENILL